MLKLFTKNLSKKFFDNSLSQKISQIFTSKSLNEEMIEEFEDLLIMTDMGSSLTSYLVKKLKEEKFLKKTAEDGNLQLAVKNFLKEELLKILTPCQKDLSFDSNGSPVVIVFNGVNGAGKTTTIGKIARDLKLQNKKILIAGCDTFRAAASSQLEIWAKKTEIEIILPNKEFEDPAAVAYRALDFATKNSFDVLLVDTAGRLQNKQNLMDELKKINRSLKKLDQNAPHYNLLILDSTVGQNALSQFSAFNQEVGIDGLILTKLDGTSKGGVVISLANSFKKPIYAIGIGEKEDHLIAFDANYFLDNLLDL